MMPSFIQVQNRIISGLHTHFNSRYAHRPPISTVLIGHKFRPGFYGQSNNSVLCGFIDLYCLFQRRRKLNLILVRNLKSVFPIRSSCQIFDF